MLREARSMLARAGALLALLALLAQAPSALAAGPLAAQGAPLTTSRYSLDLFEGPVLSSNRITALSGAYAAMAEGVEGLAVSAAAPAVREPWSSRSTDYDLTLGFTSPTSLGQSDIDNNGSPGFRYRNFGFVTAGGQIQFGEWGIGVLADAQSYRLDQTISPTDQRLLEVGLGRIHLLFARRFFDGELVLGAGVRTALLSLSAITPEDPDSSQELGSIEAGGVEAGALWAPLSLPVRASLTVRSEVGGNADVTGDVERTPEEDLRLAGLYLPSRVVLPWEVEAGVALQLGPRPLNFPWVAPSKVPESEREAMRQTPEDDDETLGRRALKERYRKLPRQKLLLLASLLVSGPVKDGIGVESFLSQSVERSGRRTVLTPRLGLEAEPIEGFLQTRVGGYLEPSRFDRGSPRMHGTAGVELKVLPWAVFGLFEEGTWWRASAMIDLARSYSSWGVSLGIWH